VTRLKHQSRIAEAIEQLEVNLREMMREER
jgi:hypothetical protein